MSAKQKLMILDNILHARCNTLRKMKKVKENDVIYCLIKWKIRQVDCELINMKIAEVV